MSGQSHDEGFRTLIVTGLLGVAQNLRRLEMQAVAAYLEAQP